MFLMKGKTKLAFALVVLALIVSSFLLFVSPIEAHPDEQSDDIINENAKTPYSQCGGIQGCRTSCGCGCAGNPNACGCGG